MPKNFSHAAHWTKEHIAVPQLEMQSIAERSRLAGTNERLRYAAVTLLAALIVAGTGAGLAEKIFPGFRVWLSGENAAIRVQSVAIVRYPTPAELRSFAARTAIPFIYPVGLPSGMKLDMIAFWPLDRPNTIFMQYRNLTGGSQSFTLVANSAVERGAPPMYVPHAAVTHWSVGNEQVIARSSSVPAAMQRSTPAASLSENVARSHNIIVLGGSEKVAAEAEAMARGRSAVFIDRGHLGQIPRLAAQNRPLLDSRMVELANIPQRNGGADFFHATYIWKRSVAIGASGVRLVNSTLTAHGGAGKCACEILYEKQANGRENVTVLPLR